MVSTQDLKNKEVINIYNGKSVGYVDDISLNLERGTVEGIIIPQSATDSTAAFYTRKFPRRKGNKPEAAVCCEKAKLRRMDE